MTSVDEPLNIIFPAVEGTNKSSISTWPHPTSIPSTSSNALYTVSNAPFPKTSLYLDSLWDASQEGGKDRTGAVDVSHAWLLSSLSGEVCELSELTDCEELRETKDWFSNGNRWERGASCNQTLRSRGLISLKVTYRPIKISGSGISDNGFLSEELNWACYTSIPWLIHRTKKYKHILTWLSSLVLDIDTNWSGEKSTFTFH